MAIDPSSSYEETNKLNQKPLELSTSLAKIESAEHHVIHCWRAYGESMLRSPRYGGSLEDVDEYVRKMGKIARENVRDCLRLFDVNPESDFVHLIHGDPEWGIVDFKARNGIDLIVMGTLARSGISGFLIGNPAEKIVSGIQCSLMAVKPDGFVSPITL